MRQLSDLFGSSQFVIGLLAGTVAFLVTLPLALALALAVWLPQRTRRPGVVGPAFVVATVAALGGAFGSDLIQSVPAEVVLGLVLLWLAGAIAARTPAPWIVGPIAALPGALVLAGQNEGLAAGWVPVVMVLGTVVIGATTANLDRRAARYGLGPLLLFIAVGGIYVTVPDTELMRAVVGVALPLVLLAWPYAAASVGAGGAFASIGLLLWIMPIEGIGRPGSIVGAVGAFALLAGEPLGRALAAWLEPRVRIHRFPIERPRVVVVVAQGLLVLYATRVAGMPQDAWLAFLLLIPGIAASVAFGVFLVIPERKRRTHKRRRSRSNLSIPKPGPNGNGRRSSNGHGQGASSN